MSSIRTLGKYELRRKIGKGAMGIVYEGFDPFIQRIVAIKTIQKSLVDPSEIDEAFARFRREAQAAGRLSHPKIVAIHDYGVDGDLAFIAMEYVSGKELKEYIDTGTHLEIGDCLHIILQVLDALDYSHKHGVIHRDIKPANILITPDGNIKVADFGIAKIDSSQLTQTGMVLGTPTYMSPEQFMGLEVDGRSDLYSAGVMLYQMLTGERPFTGSAITLMNKVMHQIPVPPSRFNPQITPELDRVVAHSMGKTPEQRYQTASEFMRALKKAAATVTTTSADKSIPFAHLVDSSILPDDSTIRQPDSLFWKKIKGSKLRSDYENYLQQFPRGAFSEQARLRLSLIDELEQTASHAQEHRVQQEKANRANTLATDQQREAKAYKARLARQLAALRAEGEREHQAAAAKQAQESTERARRQQELAALAIEHTKKFAEAMTKREAEDTAKAELAKESRRKLRQRVQRSSKIEK